MEVLKGGTMKSVELTEPPVAHTAMLIRRPVSEVFEAIIDPAITNVIIVSSCYMAKAARHTSVTMATGRANGRDRNGLQTYTEWMRP
jgi:hypothetical protein